MTQKSKYINHKGGRRYPCRQTKISRSILDLKNMANKFDLVDMRRILNLIDDRGIHLFFKCRRLINPN